MAIARIVTKTLVAASANNICLSQGATANTALTINGTTASGGVATLDTQRRVLVTFNAGEGANRNIVISGTNQFGNAISETVICVSGGTTVATVQDFLTVTSIVPQSTFSNNITVGTNTTGSTPWIFANLFSTPVNFAVGCIVVGSVTYSVEYTYDNPNAVGLIAGVIPNPFVVASLSSKSANADGAITTPFIGWRLTITGGTGSVTATGIQVGVSQ